MFIGDDDEQLQQHARIIHALDQEESDSDEMDHKQGTDEEESRDRFMINKTPSQDMFYKNERMKSQDSLKQSRAKNRSEERTSTKIPGQQLRQNHSQSIKISEDQRNNDS